MNGLSTGESRSTGGLGRRRPHGARCHAAVPPRRGITPSTPCERRAYRNQGSRRPTAYYSIIYEAIENIVPVLTGMLAPRSGKIVGLASRSFSRSSSGTSRAAW